jgi:Zn-dependent alcohol dehydrogenase
VSAAATQVPAIHSCEVTAAAEADATLAIVSVRVFRRRSSSRSAERVAGGMRTGQGSDVGSGAVAGSRTHDADVAVVGAGLAGLAAARRLSALGASVVVVEARDRVGGRVQGHEIGGDKVVEVGGQWIGPTQDRLAALSAELGVDTFPTHGHGDNLIEYGGKLRRYRGTIPRIAGRE